MTETETTGSPPASAARIDHVRDADRSFVIAPENRDLFVRTGRQVIAACNTQLGIERWLALYEEMLRSVRDFAQAHAAQVERCYAVPIGTKTAFRFVPRTESFDFELAEALAELQFDFQQRFLNLLGSIEVGQVPGWELDRFVDAKRSQLIYPATSGH